jgi:hypothetical protein
MQFTIEHQRQTMGQQVSVKVVAGTGQSMIRMTTVFDGFTVGDDVVEPGTTQYERCFDGQDARIGADHKVMVTAFDQNDSPESATKLWTDRT